MVLILAMQCAPFCSSPAEDEGYLPIESQSTVDWPQDDNPKLSIGNWRLCVILGLKRGKR
jgi:hypothetical protein